MQKMKKSKVKPRSQRSIQMEEENKRIIAEMEQKEQKKQDRKNMMFTIVASFYSLIFGIFSWLMDWFGVIALVSVISGVIGLKLNKAGTKREKIAAWVGIAFGGLRFAQQMISFIGSAL